MNFNLILKFLKDLSRNNNRNWFEKNKARYLEAKGCFETFVAPLLAELIRFDSSLAGIDPRKTTFRIYRDVRFSKDKRPYKTNMGAAFSAAGKGLGVPGYYMHIEPGNKSFVAGGLYMPEPANLARVRQEIDYNGDRLARVMHDKAFKKLFAGFWDEEKLSRPPKGFTPDHPYVEWLKLKSFITTHSFTDAEVKDGKFMKKVTTAFRTVKPLNDFLKEALA